MTYKSYKSGAFNIHTIKTDKFKNCQIEVMFKDKIKKEDVTKRIMLGDLLCESSNDHKDHKSFYKQKEMLYNLLFYSTTTRIGEVISSHFTSNFIDPKYTEGNFLENVIELLCNTILKPNIENNAFSKKSFDIVYQQIKSGIEMDQENSSKYSVTKMLENMDSNSPASIKMNGYLEDLEQITPENLYEYYQEFISHNYCDIFVIGNLDMEKVVKLINKYFDIKTIKNHKLNLTYDIAKRTYAKKIKENTKFKQSILVIGCNLLNLTKREKDIVMFIYNSILGSSSVDSKLGNNLRQQNSLCYNVGSYYQKYDSMLIIRTSFNEEYYNLAVKLIKKSLMEMKKGNITDEEFNNAKLSIISGLKIALDNQTDLLSNYIMHITDNLPLIEDRIKLFNNITKDEVVKVSKKIKINTLYLLSVGGGLK